MLGGRAICDKARRKAEGSAFVEGREEKNACYRHGEFAEHKIWAWRVTCWGRVCLRCAQRQYVETQGRNETASSIRRVNHSGVVSLTSPGTKQASCKRREFPRPQFEKRGEKVAEEGGGGPSSCTVKKRDGQELAKESPKTRGLRQGSSRSHCGFREGGTALGAGRGGGRRLFKSRISVNEERSFQRRSRDRRGRGVSYSEKEQEPTA